MAQCKLTVYRSPSKETRRVGHDFIRLIRLPLGEADARVKLLNFPVMGFLEIDSNKCYCIFRYSNHAQLACQDDSDIQEVSNHEALDARLKKNDYSVRVLPMKKRKFSNNQGGHHPTTKLSNNNKVLTTSEIVHKEELTKIKTDYGKELTTIVEAHNTTNATCIVHENSMAQLDMTVQHEQVKANENACEEQNEGVAFSTQPSTENQLRETIETLRREMSGKEKELKEKNEIIQNLLIEDKR